MFRILTLNNIATKGLSKFDRDRFELSADMSNPHAVVLRSHQLTSEHATPGLLAVGRAGAGVNNIPVADFTESGIVVFNTPGANANAVKELVLAGLLLSRRGIVQGIDYVESLKSESDKATLNKLVESSKKQFKGSELKGKSLGILGLGAIGSMVAEMGLQLGMQVFGYDPSLSIESAWRLSSQVKKVDNIQALFAKSDIVSLHVPSLPATQGMINSDVLSVARKNAILLNFARAEIVDTLAVKEALGTGNLAQYISDFPTPDLIGMPGVMATPHLGASTVEAEENCAVMVAEQMLDFLLNGNIVNSVNFPSVNLERSETGSRIAISNRNVPRMLGSVLSILADRDINVIDMLNKSRQEVAYNLIDVETEVDSELEDELRDIDGVINVRMFN